jgi:predicted TIM-barrel fold metal-dependent hydrolase
VKLSSGFRRPDRDLPAEYTQDLLVRFGPGKLLWGSDSPFVGHEGTASYAQVVEDFHYAVPDADTRDALGRSAYSFYFAR